MESLETEYIEHFLFIQLIKQVENEKVWKHAIKCLCKLAVKLPQSLVEERVLPIIFTGLKGRAPEFLEMIKHISKLIPLIREEIIDSQLFPVIDGFTKHSNRFIKEGFLKEIGLILLKLLRLKEQKAPKSFDYFLDSFLHLDTLCLNGTKELSSTIILPNIEVLGELLDEKLFEVNYLAVLNVLNNILINSELVEDTLKIAIASQLDKIARLAKDSEVESLILPLLDEHLLNPDPKKSSERVRNMAVKYLAPLLKHVSSASRERFADVFQELLSSNST